MSTKTTPAVKRAERSLRDDGAYSDDIAREYLAEHALAAALTDPDDPDSLARTLFVLHSGVAGWRADESLVQWHAYAELDRVPWRQIADGLRMMLTGSGS